MSTQTEIFVGPVLGGKASGTAIVPLSSTGPLDEFKRLTTENITKLQNQLNTLRQQLVTTAISVPMLVASGPNHQAGVVPDPGTTSGTAKFLREDASFSKVGGADLDGTVGIANGGTGSTAQTWTALSSGLQNSWTDTGGSDAASGYSKWGNILFLRGAITGGTTTDNTLLFTLPAGYRPSGRVMASVGLYNGSTVVAAFLLVATNGEVRIFGAAANNNLHLDCTFAIF